MVSQCWAEGSSRLPHPAVRAREAQHTYAPLTCRRQYITFVLKFVFYTDTVFWFPWVGKLEQRCHLRFANIFNWMLNQVMSAFIPKLWFRINTSLFLIGIVVSVSSGDRYFHAQAVLLIAKGYIYIYVFIKSYLTYIFIKSYLTWMTIYFLVFTVSRLRIPCPLVPHTFLYNSCEYQFLYLTVKVQRELFFWALKLQKIKLRETILECVVKPSLCKAPLQFCHHGND